jgi:hypothetical protein
LLGELKAPGTICRQGKRGRRRTRQDQISLGLKTAGEIADLKIRTERRKLVSSAGPVFDKGEPFESTIQPFDLMSRRHPLSSTRAALSKICFEKQTVVTALVTCRHQAAGNF